MNFRIKKKVFAISIGLSVLMACQRVPDYVIKPDEMAELMADVRMADAVVAIQRNDYPDDAQRLALKNAVLERHGVSEEKFDTSLIWYGKNISIYQDITKSSIEILERRLKEASLLAAGDAAMSVSGDSVDIWDASRFYVFNHRSPTQFIAFDFENDPNWEQGDVYTLRSRLINSIKSADWNLTAVYDDGAIETITSNISLDNPSRQELTLVTDSTRVTAHISGWIRLDPLNGHPAIIDSIGLMRRRTSPALAKTKKYSQKQILPKREVLSDTIENEREISRALIKLE